MKQQATEYLTQRYNEQALKYPLMRKDISLELYLKRNLPYAIRNLKNKETNQQKD